MKNDKSSLSEGSQGHRALSSPVIELERLSAAEAEHVIAALWCLLEEYGLASPSVAVQSANGSLNLSFVFASPEEADLVASRSFRVPAGCDTP